MEHCAGRLSILSKLSILFLKLTYCCDYEIKLYALQKNQKGKLP